MKFYLINELDCIKMMWLFLYFIVFTNTGRRARPGCTYCGQILLWPKRVWPCCLLSERLLQSEGLFPLYVFSLSGRILSILASVEKTAFSVIAMLGNRRKNCPFLCLKSGEKKKDDETVDSLGEDFSYFALCLKYSIFLLPYMLNFFVISFCCTRSSGKGSGAQRGPARTASWAQQEAQCWRVGRFYLVPVRTVPPMCVYTYIRSFRGIQWTSHELHTCVCL